MQGGIGFGRSLFVGFVLGVMVIVGLWAWVRVTGTIPGLDKTTEPPGRLLLIGVTTDAAGSNLGGLLAFVDIDGTVEVVDADTRVAIPGTSFDRVQDAYAFGGGVAVADALASASGSGETPDWVVLRPAAWTSIVDEAGGARIDVPYAVNAFVSGGLLTIDAGAQRLDGAELHALWASADFFEVPARATSTRRAVTEATVGVITSEWTAVNAALADGDADSSLTPSALQSFGELAAATQPR